MKNVRCAVIGTGRLGIWHAKNIACDIPGTELQMIVDLNERTAEKTAVELDVPRWTTSIKEVMEADDIDALIIATPSKTHGDLLKQAISHNKHAFVEKPVSHDIEEAVECENMTVKSSCVYQIGFMRRFDPVYEEARERIAAGDIGEPVYFKSITRDSFVPGEDFVKHSGDIFLDVFTHDFDAARYLMNDEITHLHAHGAAIAHPEMKGYDVDQALSFFRFAGGAAGDIEGSRNGVHGYDIQGEIIGTEGALQLGDNYRTKLLLHKNQRATIDLHTDFATRFKESYKEEIRHFIACILDQEMPRASIKDGRKALELSLAAQRALREKKEIII